jgi:hypothetical protein
MKELWRSCLLSVGMDKQERILEKWREYVEDLNRASLAGEGEGCDGGDGGEGGVYGEERRARNAQRAKIAAYRKRWEGSVSSSGRAAVKNVSEDVVRELEAQMLPCLFGAADQVEMYPKDRHGFGYPGDRFGPQMSRSLSTEDLSDAVTNGNAPGGSPFNLSTLNRRRRF